MVEEEGRGGEALHQCEEGSGGEREEEGFHPTIFFPGTKRGGRNTGKWKEGRSTMGA